MPEVDAFMGVDQIAEVSRIVREAMAHRSTQPVEGARPARKKKPAAPKSEINMRPQYVPDVETPRFRLTPQHFAYVKIAEGCNHPCSFCIIPRMRGSHRSRQQADIVAEAKELIAQGVKELNLISQDSTYYGMDLRPGHRRTISSPEKFARANADLPEDAATLCSLLRELNAIPGDFWIRLLYTHPAHWTDELIQTIAECPKVARYVDMPLQHIHDTMLERMRRETDGQYIRDLIARIREGIPGIAIRTTFIIGFLARQRSGLRRCSILSATQNSSGWVFSPIRRRTALAPAACVGKSRWRPRMPAVRRQWRLSAKSRARRARR